MRKKTKLNPIFVWNFIAITTVKLYLFKIIQMNLLEKKSLAMASQFMKNQKASNSSKKVASSLV